MLDICPLGVGVSMKDIDVICITHYHADHVAGLPGLLLTMGNFGRTEPVLVTGPEGLEEVLYATDTRPVPTIEQYGHNADLMILEGIYPEEKKLNKAIERGHMLYREAAELQPVSRQGNFG